MYFPTKPIFQELARQGNLIPVYREIIADVETPVSAFMKLDAGGDTFLLESAESAERFGRYSFVGCDPRVILIQRGKEVTLKEDGAVKRYSTDKDPLEELAALMARYRPITYGELPIFYGGAVGFLSYEAARFF
jgi:anthranilate synthase component 1